MPVVTSGISNEPVQIPNTQIEQSTPTEGGILDGATRSFRDALARVERSERFVEHSIRRVSRGADLSAGELLALQAQVYRASQQAELISKAVDRVSDTVREITQLRV